MIVIPKSWSIAAIVAILLIVKVLFPYYFSANANMEPTLQLGDHLLVERLSSIFHMTYRRGDIVTFYPPAIENGGRDLNWDIPHIIARYSGSGFFRDEAVFVRRVIGVPGDHITVLSNFGVVVNGQLLNELGWVKSPASYSLKHMSDIRGFDRQGAPIQPYAQTPQSSNEIVVPPDCYFLLADRRDNSSDSHVFGMVSRDRIIGRTFAKASATFDRLSWLDKDDRAPFELTAADVDRYSILGSWSDLNRLSGSIIRKNPKDIGALLAQSKIEAGGGKIREALETCDKILALDSRCESALSRKGSLLMDSSRRKSGTEQLKRLVQISEKNVSLRVLLMRAYALETLGEKDAAKKLFELIVAKDSDNISPYEKDIIADAYLALGKFTKGKEILTPLGKVFYNASPVVTVLAYCRARSGDLSDALKEFARIKQVEPDSMKNELAWGLALQAAQRYQEATEHFSAVLEVDSLSKFALYHRETCNYESGNYDDALTDINKIILLEPDSPDPLMDRAKIYACTNRYEESVADCKKVIALNPQSYSAWSQLGRSLASQEKWKEAHDASDHALKLRGNWSFDLSNRGWANQKLGDLKAATADFNGAVRNAPKDSAAYFSRGLFLRDQQLYKESIADFSKAIKLDSTNEQYFCARGCAEVRSGKYQQAIDDCTASLKINDQRSHPHVSRGEAYLAQGKLELALKDLTCALDIYPDDYEALQKRAEVNQRLGHLVLAKADSAHAKKLEQE